MMAPTLGKIIGDAVLFRETAAGKDENHSAVNIGGDAGATT
jgi:hypothetical protein